MTGGGIAILEVPGGFVSPLAEKGAQRAGRAGDYGVPQVQSLEFFPSEPPALLMSSYGQNNVLSLEGGTMEATLWRIKNFAGWIAGVVGTILAWIAGFELLTKFVQAQNTISWIATTY